MTNEVRHFFCQSVQEKQSETDAFLSCHPPAQTTVNVSTYALFMPENRANPQILGI
jgi:hypothetical protein